MQTFFKFLFVLPLIIAVMLMAGFLHFIHLVPAQRSKPLQTDAIVVLTGGDKRIEEGFDLLKQKVANRLFITGVDIKVKRLHEVTSCYNALDPEDRQKVEFGQNAENTLGNATEVKEWITKNNINSITLVTASYHLPRSLMIFKEIFPEIKITPYPVFTSNFKIHQWWRYPGSTVLLLKEYSKCLFMIYKHWTNRLI